VIFQKDLGISPTTNRDFIMKQIIRLTESDLRKIIEASVRRVIQEGAFDKYQNDLMDIELDSNQNINDLGMASIYSQMNDPMVRNITGSTMRSMMSDRMGNKIDSNSESLDNIEGRGQDNITNQWLNTPNAARNFKEFPRQSRINGGVKNYDSLANGSERINRYKMGRG
jgi:hypothetical protein